MWHKFQPPLRQMIVRALIEASRDNRIAARNGDFLRAIEAQPECSAARIIAQLRGTPPPSPDEMSETPAPANAIDPDAMKMIEQAYEEAAEMGDRLIGTDHLLLALTKTQGSLDAESKGLAYPQVRREVRRLRRLGLGPDAPADDGFGPIGAVGRLLRKWIAGARRFCQVYVRLSVAHPKFVTDPYPMYRRLRRQGEVRKDPLLPGWTVTGYPEIQQVLRDPRFSSEPRSARTKSGTMEIETLPAGPVRRQLCVIANVLTRQLVFMDSPNHARVRNQFGRMFSPRAVEALRPRVQQIADELIDRMIESGRMDFIRDFAYPLPLRVVAEIMGFRHEDPSTLKRWSDIFAVTIGFGTTIRQDLEARASMIEMRKYFDVLVEDLRRRPDGSLLSGLVCPSDGGREIDLDELFANCVFLLAAGHETTTSVLGSGLLALLKRPGELRRLRDDETLIPNAVEELLRFESPVQWTSRRAKEDLELGGVRIPRTAMVLISMGAGNRDPRQFPDPDRIDLKRANAGKNLAFSGGNHYCLGAGLARIELQVALHTLLRRLIDLRVEEGFRVEWRGGTTLHSFDSLPIRFQPASRCAAVGSPASRSIAAAQSGAV